VRNLFKSILIGVSLFNPAVTYADGSDRCAVRECTCVVTPNPRQTIRVNEVEVRRRVQIFFAENGSHINPAPQRTLETFASNLSAGNQRYSITLIGYTDGCGDSRHNQSLAAERVEEVKKVIREHLPSARISVTIAGEQSIGHDPGARRVDVVAHTNSSLSTRIDKIPADAYLIDASGSMWSQYRDWEDVIDASVRADSEVYVSMMQGCRNGQSLASIQPQGGTEIWYSYWYVLGRMNPGETLLIISDYDSNVPLTSSERAILEERARNRQINVISVR
jgi:hypothetical protein